MDERPQVSDRQCVVQWMVAAQRQVEAGRRDRAHELLSECLALEPDNALVARAFIDNWRALAEDETRRPPKRFLRGRSRTIRQVGERLLRHSRDVGALEDLVTLLAQVTTSELLSHIVPVICHVEPRVSSEVYRIAAEAMTELGRLEEAVVAWRALADRDPRDEEAPAVAQALTSILEAGAAAATRGLPSGDSEAEEWDEDAKEIAVLEARAACAQELARSTGDAKMQRLADRLAEHHRDAAIDIYRRRLERFPGRQDWRAALMRLLDQSGNPGAAAMILEEAPEPPEDPALLWEAARVWHRRREFERALEAYGRAIKRLPPGQEAAETLAGITDAIELAKALGREDLASEWTKRLALLL